MSGKNQHNLNKSNPNIMVLIIQDKATGKVHEVVKYLTSTTKEQCVWTATWPGRHIIGQDCEWFNVSQRVWDHISIIRDNPDLTINQLTEKTGVSYHRLYRIIEYYDLPVKREKGERTFKPKEKGKAGGWKYFNPNKQGNWMM